MKIVRDVTCQFCGKASSIDVCAQCDRERYEAAMHETGRIAEQLATIQMTCPQCGALLIGSETHQRDPKHPGRCNECLSAESATYAPLCSACHGTGFIEGFGDEPEWCDHPDCSYWAPREAEVDTGGMSDAERRARAGGEWEWISATIEHLRSVGLIEKGATL